MARGVLRVDVVDANVFVLDEDFAFFGDGDGQISAVLKDFGASGFLLNNAAHCFGEVLARHCARGAKVERRMEERLVRASNWLACGAADE